MHNGWPDASLSEGKEHWDCITQRNLQYITQTVNETNPFWDVAELTVAQYWGTFQNIVTNLEQPEIYWKNATARNIKFYYIIPLEQLPPTSGLFDLFDSQLFDEVFLHWCSWCKRACPSPKWFQKKTFLQHFPVAPVPYAGLITSTSPNPEKIPPSQARSCWKTVANGRGKVPLFRWTPKRKVSCVVAVLSPSFLAQRTPANSASAGLQYLTHKLGSKGTANDATKLTLEALATVHHVCGIFDLFIFFLCSFPRKAHGHWNYDVP